MKPFDSMKLEQLHVVPFKLENIVTLYIHCTEDNASLSALSTVHNYKNQIDPRSFAVFQNKTTGGYSYFRPLQCQGQFPRVI